MTWREGKSALFFLQGLQVTSNLTLSYLGGGGGGRGGFRPHVGDRKYNPILPGGDSAPLMFFFHHPETAQAMKLKVADFKDTCLRHILQVISGCYILRCYHGNKIRKGTLQN